MTNHTTSADTILGQSTPRVRGMSADSVRGHNTNTTMECPRHHSAENPHPEEKRREEKRRGDVVRKRYVVAASADNHPHPPLSQREDRPC